MSYKFKLLPLYVTLCLAFILIGCQESLSPAEVEPVIIQRFDRDVSKAKDLNSLTVLAQKYGTFYQSYCQDILELDCRSRLCNEELLNFTNFYGIKLIQHEVDSVFPNLNEIEQQLTKAKGYFVSAFPERRFPDFASFISEYTYANVTYDSLVGIGLDMYLGSTYKMYLAVDFPQFMINKLRKDYIAANALKAVAIGMFEKQLKDKRFLPLMLFEGKVRYFVKSLLPELNDSIVLGITGKQLTWCKENEPQMWAHYIEKNILYSTEPEKYMRYINDGPFTVADGVPQESAPGIGVYTGLQIIKHWAEEENLTLKEVMENNNWDEILTKSKYRPE